MKSLRFDPESSNQRGDYTARQNDRSQEVKRSALIVAFLMLGAGCSATQTAKPAETSPSVPLAKPSRTVSPSPCCSEGKLAMFDFRFQPTKQALLADATLIVMNEGDNEHNLTIPAMHPPGVTEGVFSVDFSPKSPGKPFRITLSPGTYEFFCKYHKDRGMTGTLEIVG